MILVVHLIILTLRFIVNEHIKKRDICKTSVKALARRLVPVFLLFKILAIFKMKTIIVLILICLATLSPARATSTAQQYAD